MEKKHDVRIDRNMLHPWLDQKLEKLLDKSAKKGIYLIITEGYRTKAYQDDLYAKGRTIPGKIVTNAKGSSFLSQHQWGIAFDIAINDSKRLYNAAMIRQVAGIAKGLGLGWGGDWNSFVDNSHFYLKKWGSTTKVLRQKYGTPAKFQKTWTGRVNRKQGLILWKNSLRKKRLIRIPDGKRVSVLYRKLWYAKVKYGKETGIVNQKYLEEEE